LLLSYAWRGFARRRTRTTLAVVGIGLAIGLLVAVLTITSAVSRAINDSMGAAGADMVVQRRVEPCPFAPVKLPKDLAAIPGDVVDKTRALPEVETVSGVLLLWAFWQGHPTVVAGVDPTLKTIGPVRISQKKTDGKSDDEDDQSCCAVTKGRYLVRYDDRHVMLTEQYARAVGKTVGDTIHLGPSDVFEIVGLVDLSGSARIAEAEAFIPLKTAQQMYGQGPIVDTIFVALKGRRHIRLVSDVIRQWIGPETSITTSDNVDAATAALEKLTSGALLGVSGLVLLFALLLIVRNALSSVAERLAEVGLMRAIGWRRLDVSRLFVAEELFGGIIGGVAGCVCGVVVAALVCPLADFKLPSALSSFPPCSTTDPPLSLPLSPAPSPLVLLIGFGAAILIGSVAGLAASQRAARLDPAEALRRL
jgi:putative ABC transport system permease protein